MVVAKFFICATKFRIWIEIDNVSQQQQQKLKRMLNDILNVFKL